MIRSAAKAVLFSAARQVAKLPLTRRAMHRLSIAARGSSVVFLRCRRVLPDTAAGRQHIDRRMGGALLASELREALITLSQSLRFAHPGEALAGLESGRRLEEAVCVVTFDESFAATAELALPILERLHIPALFFVTTGYLEAGSGTLWDQAVHTALDAHAPTPLSVPWVDRVLATETPAQRASSVRRLLLGMVPLDPAHLDDRLTDLWSRIERRAPPLLDRMLTAEEVRRLARHPLVSLGAHGHRHHALSSLSDEPLEEELGRPRQILKELGGAAFCDVVSYPFGRPPYFDDRVMTAARRAGYRAALTGVPGVARPGDHLFQLPRLPLGPGTRAAEAYELQGVSEAVDELILVAAGAEDRVVPELEG